MYCRILGFGQSPTFSCPAKGIPVTGSLSLDDVSKRYRMLEVRCENCSRSGSLRIDKLIDEHGHDMSFPDLRTILAGDWEHESAARRKDRCQVFYPQIRELTRESAP
jgi:hypothetical protein